MAKPILDLTVIIPNYNTRGLLRNCIDSIYSHTEGIAFEIICVDGNSPDGSAAMVAKEFPNVILVRNQCNESYGRSVNQGLRMARGRYACLLDSDTMLIGNAFQSLVRFMDHDSRGCRLRTKAPERRRNLTARHSPLREPGCFLPPDAQLAQNFPE